MIIAVTNQKGGIGKSSTAQAIGAYYANAGKKVLLVDLDAQQNLSMAAGLQEIRASSYDIMKDPNLTATAVLQIRENLYIIPASDNLSSVQEVLPKAGREFRLKEALSGLSRFDYIILDTPPALSDLTVNALTAADIVVIPAQADYFSLEAIKELVGTIQVVQRYTNPKLKIDGILLTRYQKRSRLTQDYTTGIEQLAAAIDTRVYKTRIRESVSIKEAQAVRTDIFTYDPKSNGAKDYLEFCKEIENNGQR